ncbi:PREDICTED: cyclic nucleotide-binding domain-containing protein 2-like, partial [Branchiostoma belcheri]|uniref:Cyclic nucleotide-binding domain-containing protein 2-like n=1 Tax=Branchiostoma belcheri TaxID=7741 RepID=A0A6P4XMK7_BRABE
DVVPSRVKELLRKSSKDRTEEEAETIVRTMQKMPDFALFPFEIQKQLCQVAWYDSFGTGRVIIREGHAADGFYFVLSGRLVESYAAEDEANTVLRHGMKFGERELLTRTKRRSTVLTQERTELFCVHAQDYDRIFNLQEDRETANLNVCRHISIFKLWPFQKLLEHPDAWTMQNYQPGFVIVPDSRRCDWIYVVKTVRTVNG